VRAGKLLISWILREFLETLHAPTPVFGQDFGFLRLLSAGSEVAPHRQRRHVFAVVPGRRAGSKESPASGAHPHPGGPQLSFLHLATLHLHVPARQYRAPAVQHAGSVDVRHAPGTGLGHPAVSEILLCLRRGRGRLRHLGQRGPGPPDAYHRRVGGALRPAAGIRPPLPGYPRAHELPVPHQSQIPGDHLWRHRVAQLARREQRRQQRGAPGGHAVRVRVPEGPLAGVADAGRARRLLAAQRDGGCHRLRLFRRRQERHPEWRPDAGRCGAKAPGLRGLQCRHEGLSVRRHGLD